MTLKTATLTSLSRGKVIRELSSRFQFTTDGPTGTGGGGGGGYGGLFEFLFSINFGSV